MKKLSMEVGERISDEDLKKMLESADKDGDGMLNFEEFYLVMKEYGNETGWYILRISLKFMTNYSSKIIIYNKLSTIIHFCLQSSTSFSTIPLLTTSKL